MNLNEIFKCQICSNILKNPVTLSCGCSVCKEHLEQLSSNDFDLNNNHNDVKNESISSFFCTKCQKDIEIPRGGIRVNHAFDWLLKREIIKLDFGKNYQLAKQECDKLKKDIAHYESIKNDPKFTIKNYYKELRTQVESLKNQIKTEVDKLSEQLMEDLRMSEEACVENLEKNNELIFQGFDEITNLNEKLDTWRLELEKFKIDEEKWTQIRKDAEHEQNNLKNEFKELNKTLLLANHWKHIETNPSATFIKNLEAKL
jgi:hypothetical protein